MRRKRTRRAGAGRPRSGPAFLALLLVLLFVAFNLLPAQPAGAGDRTPAAQLTLEEAQAQTARAQARVADAWAGAEARKAQAWGEQQALRQWLLTLLLAGGLVLVLAVAWGIGRALVQAAHLRACLIQPAQGLYPAIHGERPVTHVNEPGAQLARLAPTRTPIQVLPPAPAPAPPAAIPEPVIIEPERLAHIERLLLASGAGR